MCTCELYPDRFPDFGMYDHGTRQTKSNPSHSVNVSINLIEPNDPPLISSCFKAIEHNASAAYMTMTHHHHLNHYSQLDISNKHPQTDKECHFGELIQSNECGRPMWWKIPHMTSFTRCKTHNKVIHTIKISKEIRENGIWTHIQQHDPKCLQDTDEFTNQMSCSIMWLYWSLDVWYCIFLLCGLLTSGYNLHLITRLN